MEVNGIVVMPNRWLSVGGAMLVSACPFILSGWLHGFGWEMEVLAAVAASGLAGLGAFVSGRHRTSQWSPTIQFVSLVLGAAALLHLLRQAAVVCLLVGFGPGAVPSWLWYFPFTGLQPGQLGVAGLALAAIPAVGFLRIRAQRRWGGRAAVIMTDALLALCLLALSYRLVGALAVVGLLLFDAKTQGKGGRGALWVLIVMLCLVPVDVSLQSGAVPGPSWLPTIAGDFTSMDAFLHGPKHGYVVLDTGSHQILYYEPRLVWAW